MSDKTTHDIPVEERKAIRVRLAGEIPDYYRSYYINEETGEFYALTNFRSVRTWHTTASNGGEPDIPLKDGLLIEIMADGQVISREVISRTDGGDAIGVPVVDPPADPEKPRRGKKAAADTSGQPEAAQG